MSYHACIILSGWLYANADAVAALWVRSCVLRVDCINSTHLTLLTKRTAINYTVFLHLFIHQVAGIEKRAHHFETRSKKDFARIQGLPLLNLTMLSFVHEFPSEVNEHVSDISHSRMHTLRFDGYSFTQLYFCTSFELVFWMLPLRKYFMGALLKIHRLINCEWHESPLTLCCV